MEPFFFRVEHDLLRSESFKTLGGSAIKVYLVIGLYADFGTGWAYPSIRTIARQGGFEPADGPGGHRGLDATGTPGDEQIPRDDRPRTRSSARLPSDRDRRKRDRCPRGWLPPAHFL